MIRISLWSKIYHGTCKNVKLHVCKQRQGVDGDLLFAKELERIGLHLSVVQDVHVRQILIDWTNTEFAYGSWQAGTEYVNTLLPSRTPLILRIRLHLFNGKNFFWYNEQVRLTAKRYCTLRKLDKISIFRTDMERTDCWNITLCVTDIYQKSLAVDLNFISAM